MALTLNAACARGDEGALEPEPALGITLGKRSVAGDTGEFRQDGVQGRLWGDWGRDAGETIDVEYRNTTSSSVNIPVNRVSITFDGEQGKIEQITDVTRVNIKDADYRNDSGRSLMEDAEAPDRPGMLDIPAGQVRRITITFLPFSEDRRPRFDDVLVLSVPTTGTAVDVPLKCAGR